MKNSTTTISTLVAILATTTLLTACGSNNDNAQAKAPAKPLSDKAQISLSTGSWLSECQVTGFAGSTSMAVSSAKTRLQFVNENMIKATQVEYKNGNCDGEGQISTDLWMYSATEKKDGVVANIHATKTVVSNYSQTEEMADSIGRYLIDVSQDGSTMDVKALRVDGKDGVDTLSGTYSREVEVKAAPTHAI